MVVRNGVRKLINCQWTRIVTRLVNPNCYEVWPSPDRAASSRTALKSPWFPGRSCTSPRVLLVPAIPSRGRCPRPQLLRVIALSTLGSSATEVRRTDSFESGPAIPIGDSSSRAIANEQNDQCTSPAAPSPDRGRPWPPDQTHYYPPSDAVDGSSRPVSLDKSTTEHDR